MRKIIANFFIGAAALMAPAFAAEIVDQSQTAIDLSRGYKGIGGGSNQRLAQTFTAGVTADLVAIRAPIIGCGGAELVLEIRLAAADGTPGGALLQTTRFSPASVPVAYAAFHEFRLASPLRIRNSVKYAFTLRMDPEALSSNCSYADSAAGDIYAGGSMFFDARPNPPGWVDPGAVPEPTRDLAFETIVETGTPPPVASADCTISVAGGGSVPLPAHTNICRCLRDEGLREFRCALLNPDFFAIRRIPWPIPLGETYVETWEVLPLTQLRDQIRIERKGADIAKAQSLIYSGKMSKLLQSRKIAIKAPKEAANVPAEATISYAGETWTIDASIPAEQFSVGAGLPSKLPKVKN